MTAKSDRLRAHITKLITKDGKFRQDTIKPGRCEFHFIICENL